MFRVVGHLPAIQVRAFTCRELRAGVAQASLLYVRRTETLSATDLRRYLFEVDGPAAAGALRLRKSNVPKPVFEMLDGFRRSSPAYAQWVAEHRFIETCHVGWAQAPYAPPFVTTDTLVVNSGHLLLLRRAAAPSHGLWTLPGGVIQSGERLLDGYLRKLRAEMRFKTSQRCGQACLLGDRLGKNGPGRRLAAKPEAGNRPLACLWHVSRAESNNAFGT